MAESRAYSFTRYLNAKRSVDDRALNRRVWSAFLDGLAKQHRGGGGLTILDLAGGIGNMALRLLPSLPEELTGDIQYTLVDVDQRVVEEATRLIPRWAEKQGYQVQVTGSSVAIRHRDVRATIDVVCADAFQFMADQPENSYDCIITQAWLDLVHLETALEQIFGLLCSGGRFYAPIHFDGVTRFLPRLNGALDAEIERIYHQSMDSRTTPHGPAAGSETGSRLLTDIPTCGGKIESVGSSDWIVRPDDEGNYPEHENYFLRYILALVEEELADDDSLSQSDAQRWMELRRSQLEAGTLCYVAHQLDVLATV